MGHLDQLRPCSVPNVPTRRDHHGRWVGGVLASRKSVLRHDAQPERGGPSGRPADLAGSCDRRPAVVPSLGSDIAALGPVESRGVFTAWANIQQRNVYACDCGVRHGARWRRRPGQVDRDDPQPRGRRLARHQNGVGLGVQRGGTRSLN